MKWYRYADGTFVIFVHGGQSLQTFLKHLIGIHEKIKCTIEKYSNKQLSFIDVTKRNNNGLFGTTVNKKETHTN